MKNPAVKNHSVLQQIYHFLVHLRWHYQLFILSGGFLMGGYLSLDMDWTSFLCQFGNVHLLLFGGATAYNSYWDRDKGPVGGLRHPPPIPSWMRPASFALQFTGLVLALFSGLFFASVYAVSILFFWLYSTPSFRWKGTPLLSLLAIGLSTGTNSLLMGYLAAGNAAISSTVWIASFGAAFIILSLYPLSQLFQIDEDSHRGDKTFAVQFGFVGVIRFFEVAFPGGLVLLSLAVAFGNWWHGIVLLMMGSIAGWWIYRQLLSLKAEVNDYPGVMRIKYVTSLAFVSFIIILLILKHLR